jgi:hypothetical protein
MGLETAWIGYPVRRTADRAIQTGGVKMPPKLRSCRPGEPAVLAVEVVGGRPRLAEPDQVFQTAVWRWRQEPGVFRTAQCQEGAIF